MGVGPVAMEVGWYKSNHTPAPDHPHTLLTQFPWRPVELAQSQQSPPHQLSTLHNLHNTTPLTNTPNKTPPITINRNHTTMQTALSHSSRHTLGGHTLSTGVVCCFTACAPCAVQTAQFGSDPLPVHLLCGGPGSPRRRARVCLPSAATGAISVVFYSHSTVIDGVWWS